MPGKWCPWLHQEVREHPQIALKAKVGGNEQSFELVLLLQGKLTGHSDIQQHHEEALRSGGKVRGATTHD